jgi:hypothetical protein
MKSGISDGMFFANRRINLRSGFVPYFFDPACQFVTTVIGAFLPRSPLKTTWLSV